MTNGRWHHWLDVIFVLFCFFIWRDFLSFHFSEFPKFLIWFLLQILADRGRGWTQSTAIGGSTLQQNKVVFIDWFIFRSVIDWWSVSNLPPHPPLSQSWWCHAYFLTIDRARNSNINVMREIPFKACDNLALRKIILPDFDCQRGTGLC